MSTFFRNTIQKFLDPRAHESHDRREFNRVSRGNALIVRPRTSRFLKDRSMDHLILTFFFPELATGGWQLSKQCKMMKNWPYCGSTRTNSTRIRAREGPLRAPHTALTGCKRNWSSPSSLEQEKQPRVERAAERLISW